MENKKVSVIIPFYSGVEWLDESVQSILNETYKNVEIIVVNDGSPEDIQPFLDKYGDKIVYRYKKNQGPAVARNLAMSIATGDYFAYEDADDIWLPTKLEKQIAFMEENSYVWSHTGFYYWWPETSKMKQVSNKYDYDNISQQMNLSFKMVTPSVVVHRSTKEEHPEINFPPELRKGQDTAYFENLAKYYKVALIQEPLVKIRMRGDNSNHQVLMRFERRAATYLEKKEEMSKGIRFIGRIYVLYHRAFGMKRGKIKEFVAKCFWTIPYTMERIYLRKIIKKIPKDEKYMLKWSKEG